jgi:hypothetical protein
MAQNDQRETKQLAEIIAIVDSMDAEYVNAISDEIFKKQPFFLTVLLGYRFDVGPLELEEIMRLYFMVWEYFRLKGNLPTKKIGEKDFEKVQNRHIKMFKYTKREASVSDRMDVYSNDLENIKSQSLFAAILLRFNTRLNLIEMDKETKLATLVGLKSFIECFETTK